MPGYPFLARYLNHCGKVPVSGSSRPQIKIPALFHSDLKTSQGMGTQAWLPPSRPTSPPSYFSKILDLDPGYGPGPWTWTWKKSFRAPPSQFCCGFWLVANLEFFMVKFAGSDELLQVQMWIGGVAEWFTTLGHVLSLYVPGFKL